jgi:hypothetical protein
MFWMIESFFNHPFSFKNWITPSNYCCPAAGICLVIDDKFPCFEMRLRNQLCLAGKN